MLGDPAARGAADEEPEALRRVVDAECKPLVGLGGRARDEPGQRGLEDVEADEEERHEECHLPDGVHQEGEEHEDDREKEHVHAQERGDLAVHFLKIFRSDEDLELVGDLLVLRHAHGADLHDLAAQRRGQRLLRAVGPGPRLVPLHVQNDILHTLPWYEIQALCPKG